MAAVQKRKIKWAISLFLVMLYFSGLPAQAKYGGGGLRGEYYQWSGNSPPSHRAAFSHLVMIRIDPQINFNWGSGAPDPAVGEDNFSVRWTGEVEAAFTETYTFYTTTDDGVRLWINDQQIIDKWRKQSATEWSGTIDLVAGQTYSILMEYFENRVNAMAQMRWSSPRTPKQLIPQAALSPPAEAQYGGGTGEPNDPYLIYTAEQMNAIGANPDDWDKHFKLMADIDLAGFTGTDFNIIGYWRDWYDTKPFIGVFDGNGHTISNFSYTSTDPNAVALFRRVSGIIKDLGLINPNVNAGTRNYVGSLVAHVWVGTITNCYAEGGSVSGNAVVGGLVGLNDGTITDCYSRSSVSGNNWVGGLGGANVDTMTRCYVNGGSVSGDQKVGGLVGRNEGIITNCSATGSVLEGAEGDVGGLVGLNLYGTITNCYAQGGSVMGTGSRVGGLVGYNWWGTITNSYATGSVSGNQWVGGLVGYSSAGTITNSYATGSVSVNQWVGGLVGYNMWSTITNSFWDTQTSGQPTSDGGTGKTTAEMKMESTFADAGWNFSTPIWTIDEGVDYPRLWWEQQESFKYGDGSGTAEDPYLIHTAHQMNAIGANPNDWDKHFKLMADIDLSGFTGTDFNIIGYYISDDDNKPFTGVFDGSGHTISNFSYSCTDTDRIGLFGYVGGSDMEIKDLGLIDPNMDAGTGSGVGSLVGLMEYGAITNCYVRNGNVSGNSLVGGLVGRTYVNTITDCYVDAAVSGFDKIGGLVGENYAGIIKNCSSVNTVNGVAKVGGLVGVNEFLMEQGWLIPGNITGCCAEGKIEGLFCIGGLVGDNLARVTDSYATADVIGSNRIGGLVGHNYLWTGAIVPPAVSYCYAVGSVSGSDNVGGLVGVNEGGTVTNSFWGIETSGQSVSGGGMGRTTSQMQMENTFTNAGWDFIDETANGTEDTWRVLEGQDYPRLNWELIEDEPNEVADPLSEAMDTSLSFTTGGSADWFSQTSTSYYGEDAAQSGDISDDQESWMQTTVSGKGTVKFHWQVSSEQDYDFLEFYIDGSLEDKISGLEEYWEHMTYTISTSGSHVLEWRYMKDSSTDEGSDCGWVDKVEWITTP